MVVVVLIAMLGAVVGMAVSRVSELRREKLQVIAPRANAAYELERAVYQQAIVFRNYALTMSPADLETFRHSVEQLSVKMQQVAALQKSQEGQSLFEEIVPIHADHQRSFEVFLSLARAGADRDALRNQEATISSYRTRLLEKVHAFASVQGQQIEAADRAIDRAVGTVRITVIVLTLLLLAASVVTSWIVSRSVRRPAVALADAAEALRRGSYEPALSLHQNVAGQGAPFRDEVREAAHVFGRMAGTLKGREERLAAHSRLSAVLSTSLDPAEVATRGLREVTSYVGAEVGAIYLTDDSSSILRVLATVALDPKMPALAVGDGIPGQAVADRRTVVIRGIPGETPFRVKLGFDDLPPRTVVASPMLLKDRVVGVIVCGALSDLSEDALAFVDEAAAQLAITLDNALAHSRIAALAVELQEANETLQAQSEELQAQGEELQAQNEELQSQTEELQAQAEELQIQQEDLARTNAALLAAEAQKDRFLAVLGHELRNPLAAITGAAELLDGGGDRQNGGAAVHDVIKRQTAHLGRLLDDLLDVGRITTGKVVLSCRPLDLGGAVERAVAAVKGEATNGPAITIAIDEPVWVNADETRIEQIVANLLTNAVKYTPADGTITVRLSRESGSAVIRVSDTGIGIEPELLPRVFDFLVQGKFRPEGKGGLGVGLTLVKNLVELHGGTVEAASEGAGRGTTITVRVPAMSEIPATLPIVDSRPNVSARSIVIVEDNPDIRQMMRILLGRAGHVVAEAEDGPDGVRIVTEVKPDVALIDLDLPGFDGCEVARQLRRNGATAGVRLIAVSGYGRPEDRDRAMAAGFDDHLVKPVDFDHLSAAVLGKREGQMRPGAASPPTV